MGPSRLSPESFPDLLVGDSVGESVGDSVGDYRRRKGERKQRMSIIQSIARNESFILSRTNVGDVVGFKVGAAVDLPDGPEPKFLSLTLPISGFPELSRSRVTLTAEEELASIIEIASTP